MNPQPNEPDSGQPAGQAMPGAQPASSQPWQAMPPQVQAMPADEGARRWNEKENRPPQAPQATAANVDPNAPQPVAYDQNGRPLYAAPPTAQVVYVTRPVDPGKTQVPAEVVARHEASCKQFPQLNLSEGEYVIASVERHSFGIVQTWAIAITLIVALAGLLVAFVSGQSGSMSSDVSSALPLAVTVLALMSVLILAGAFVASYVYKRNKFYLTNESVIQEIQNGLFNRREQTVSLGSIEDASYRQDNLLQSMFNFGAIRLSTVGDETTYRFNYVADPKRTIAMLNNAVEDFKNGRRVGE